MKSNTLSIPRAMIGVISWIPVFAGITKKKGQRPPEAVIPAYAGIQSIPFKRLNIPFAILGLISILSLAFTSICLADNNDFSTEITQANIQYSNKQYQEAAKGYETLIAKGYNNGHLYYNLGNAYYRLGQMGPAILNYIKAKSLIPRDKDLEANLKSANAETVDRLEEKQPGNIFILWLDNHSQVETIEHVAVASILFWLTLTLRLFFKTGFLRLARNTALCLLLFTVISAGAKHHRNANHLICVVLANTIDVKSTSGAEGVTLFQLHEGAVASVSERKDGWYQIELPDGKKGWVMKESVGI